MTTEPQPGRGGIRRAQPGQASLMEDDAMALAQDMVRALPDHALADLRALLGQSIALPSPAERRQATLGLLMRLVIAGQGEIPPIADYQRAHQQARAAGEDWPAATTLARLHRGWTGAVLAAACHAFDGPAARVPASAVSKQPGASYTVIEVRDALDRCARCLGRPPTEREFDHYCAAERQIARRMGTQDPRAPTRKARINACGHWESLTALRACRHERTTNH